jgi:DNA-binding MarR family transcriptional regulator
MVESKKSKTPKESAKTRKTYLSSTSGALSHPMRQTLYDLIRRGITTVPELAEILNENRINLYHHLKVLEDQGFISSYFGQDRTKQYKIHLAESKKIKIPIFKKEMNLSKLINEKESIILNPPENQDESIKFREKVKELLAFNEIGLPDTMDINNVIITIESHHVSQQIQEQMQKKEIS